MTAFVGADHSFHDPAFVQEWANRFVPTAPRLAMFDMILDQLRRLQKPAAHVLELGIGPGYMARHILEREDTIRYEGLDFSEAFFGVARKTLGPLAERVRMTKADMTDPAWPARLSSTPDAIVSTWALHDLGSQEAVADVYNGCHLALPEGGILLNGDFIKPDGIAIAFEPGRFAVSRHLELLEKAGFGAARCLGQFDQEMSHPSAAQNYACIMAVK